jgi:hypothetical protein
MIVAPASAVVVQAPAAGVEVEVGHVTLVMEW